MAKNDLNKSNQNNNFLKRTGKYINKEQSDITPDNEYNENSIVNNQNNIRFNNNLQLDNADAEITMPIKAKYTLIVIILIVLFFSFFMLFIVLNINYFENGNGSEYPYYGDGVCKQVKYADNTLNLEEYVANVIAGEVKDFSPETLKTFAIAARTFAISKGTKVGDDNSCYYDVTNILQSYKPENKSQNHIDAAKETKGLIITIDGQIAGGLYDASCVYTAEQANKLDIDGDYNEDNYYIRYGSEEIGGINFQPVLKSSIPNIVGSLNYYAQKATTDGPCPENHGYGMSQNGAEYLETIEEYDWKRIIDYYYQGKATIMTIEKKTGGTTFGEGVIYRQGDPAWGSIPLGNSTATMKSAGCAVTSIAIGISFSGAEINSPSFDPGVFVTALNAGDCFTSSGLIIWYCSAITEMVPTMHVAALRQVEGKTNEEKIALINSYPLDKYIVITQYKNASTYSHYVNFQEFIDSNTYLSRDPGQGKLVTHSIAEIDQIVVYSY